MTPQEIDRLRSIDVRIAELCREWGLLETEIIFQVVPAQRVLEGMSYEYPENFSYWQFGRDYEKNRTIYEHTGTGIPYEQVWNLDPPIAFLVETNPLVLNILIDAHVRAHVDFFLRNKYVRHARDTRDIANEAYAAAQRFQKYEGIHGIDELEKTMDAVDSFRWHQPLDMLMDEDIQEEELREDLITRERAKLEREKDANAEFANPLTDKEIKEIEERLRLLSIKTPPRPMYDILLYILRHSKKPLRAWREDIVSVMRDQSRHLYPMGRTKLLDEGWATYWHTRIMRRLFEENLLTAEEHGIFNYYHAGVCRENKYSLNWYRVGPALYEYIEERWNKGQFGKEYDECEDPHTKAYWDTHINLGSQKIFEVTTHYTDRMAVEHFFTDEFIHRQKLYVYQQEIASNGEIVDKIVEDRPAIVREILKNSWTLYGTPIICVEDGDFNKSGELLLSHKFAGNRIDVLPYLELQPPSWRERTLEHAFYLWGKTVHLNTFEFNDAATKSIRLVRYVYNGQAHRRDFIKEFILPPDGRIGDLV